MPPSTLDASQLVAKVAGLTHDEDPDGEWVDVDFDAVSVLPSDLERRRAGTVPSAEFAGLATDHRDREAIAEDVLRLVGQRMRERALDDAYRLAERGMLFLDNMPHKQASMLWVQAQAAFWKGQFQLADGHAIRAYELAGPESEVGCRVIGLLATLSAALGNARRLDDLVEAVRVCGPGASSSPAYAIACCQLAIGLLRSGWPERVEGVLGPAQGPMYELGESSPEVRGWTNMVRAELSSHAGDHAASLALTQAAAEAFDEAGDALWALVARSEVANDTMQLGDYAEAHRLLLGLLDSARAFGVGNTTVHTLNLGLVEARLGKLGAAREHVCAAMQEFDDRGDTRGQVAARVYLSEVLMLSGDLAGAEMHAQIAVDKASGSPVAQAEALGQLAMVLQARPMEAFMAACHAMDLLRSLGGVEEGEARIRLAYALSLRALGHNQEGEAALDEANERLLERAKRISNDRWRASFLERVPEHARTRRLVTGGSIGE